MMTGRQHYAGRHSEGMYDARRAGSCTGYTALAAQGTLTAARQRQQMNGQ